MFIEEFSNEVTWSDVICYSDLSESFIKRFEDEINCANWYFISSNKNLSEDFIVKFQDKLNWNYISVNYNLSEDFIVKFQDKLNWNHIFRYQNLSEEFKNKFSRFNKNINLKSYKIKEQQQDEETENITNDFFKNIYVDNTNLLINCIDNLSKSSINNLGQELGISQYILASWLKELLILKNEKQQLTTNQNNKLNEECSNKYKR
jgi:hypothetical protein